MAEFVEQRMEEMIPEAEELERCNLLTGAEVKELLRRRKHFEYKIQKRTKKKEDFLSYIQYETNLLQLITMRREAAGYHHKKGNIEHAIKNRINKLYKILCLRWQSDEKTWLSHIAWLEQVNWKASVSRVHLRLLQVHSQNPKLWVAAAKFELENGGADSGRQILLRGIRFHPNSRLLHREYVKFELLYVEKLKERQSLLLKGQKEENKQQREELVEDPEAVDSVLNCSIVKLAIEAAVAAVEEADFLLEMLVLVREFAAFSQPVETFLLDTWLEKYPTHPLTLDTKARLLLEKDGEIKERIRLSLHVYEEALQQPQEEELELQREVFNRCFQLLTQLPQLAPSCPVFILTNILRMLEFGQDRKLLLPDHYDFWLQILDVDKNRTRQSAVLDMALAAWPQHLDFLELRLHLAALTGGKDGASQALRSALDIVTCRDGRLKLWQGYLQMMKLNGWWEEGYQQLEKATQSQLNNGELRVLLLEETRERGIQLARQVYNKNKLLPPFNMRLHRLMLEIEQDQEKPSTTDQRAVYSTLCDQFGASSVESWLDWINWEERLGRGLESAALVCRAEATLDKNLVAKFATLRSLRQLND